MARILEGCVWDDTGMWLDAARWDGACNERDYNQIVSSAFSLDGHDFYVLRLGANGTLVYDLTTGSWSQWDSAGRTVWRVNSGFNWSSVLGSLDPNAPSTNIILGDDTFSTLWTLSTEQYADDGPFAGDDPQQFTRAAMGGIPLRSRQSVRCNAVTLTASTGDPSMVTTTITLRYSDDNGQTYANAGTVVVQSNDFTREIRWRSLGLMRAPGRIFEIIDSGTSVRLDGLDVDLMERG